MENLRVKKSPGGTTDNSPRREPWEKVGQTSKPRKGRKKPRTSFALTGLCDRNRSIPTADAVGYDLTPLRGFVPKCEAAAQCGPNHISCVFLHSAEVLRPLNLSFSGALRAQTRDEVLAAPGTSRQVRLIAASYAAFISASVMGFLLSVIRRSCLSRTKVIESF